MLYFVEKSAVTVTQIGKAICLSISFGPKIVQILGVRCYRTHNTLFTSYCTADTSLTGGFLAGVHSNAPAFSRHKTLLFLSMKFLQGRDF